MIKDMDSYYARHPPDPLVPLHNIGLEASAGEWQAKNAQTASTPPWLVYPLLAMVLLGLSGFFFYQRFSKGQLLALLMLNVLIGGFSLLIIFLPLGHSQQWLAPIIFFSLFGLFRFMSRFENK